MPGRIMALDYGSKTVGVALTDPLCITAQPFETITRKSENKLRQTLARIAEIVSEKNVEKIVLGLPLNMDGSAGERVIRTLEFRNLLEKRTQIPIEMQDERLTTVEADAMLDEMNIPRGRRKEYIDQVAAALILKEYLENK